jgi:hypothetical protein
MSKISHTCVIFPLSNSETLDTSISTTFNDASPKGVVEVVVFDGNNDSSEKNNTDVESPSTVSEDGGELYTLFVDEFLVWGRDSRIFSELEASLKIS